MDLLTMRCVQDPPGEGSIYGFVPIRSDNGRHRGGWGAHCLQAVGQGPPLFLVHGAADDSRTWRPQLDDLADEFTVVAWDEPGAGRSSDLPKGFELADYAHCLAALIETVELGPVHIAGLSWGGTVVLELYRRHPELVATLILIDTYAGWKGSLPAEEVLARAAGRPADARRAA